MFSPPGCLLFCEAHFHNSLALPVEWLAYLNTQCRPSQSNILKSINPKSYCSRLLNAFGGQTAKTRDFPWKLESTGHLKLTLADDNKETQIPVPHSGSVCYWFTNSVCVVPNFLVLIPNSFWSTQSPQTTWLCIDCLLFITLRSLWLSLSLEAVNAFSLSLTLPHKLSCSIHLPCVQFSSVTIAPDCPVHSASPESLQCHLTQVFECLFHPTQVFSPWYSHLTELFSPWQSHLLPCSC